MESEREQPQEEQADRTAEEAGDPDAGPATTPEEVEKLEERDQAEG